MMNANNRPTIGVIVPPAEGRVPPECTVLYGNRARFIAAGLGLKSLTPDGYDAVVDMIADTARDLAVRGADAVVLMGTSLSFYRGEAFNAQLVEEMVAAAGKPATTMSNAVVDALRTLGSRRIAVGTAYVDAVNDRLKVFLASHGFVVTGLAALKIDAVAGIDDVTASDLKLLARRAEQASDEFDAVFLSCGGLRTLGVTAGIEAETGKPVISSAVAGAWAAIRLVGEDATVEGFGQLLEGPSKKA